MRRKINAAWFICASDGGEVARAKVRQDTMRLWYLMLGAWGVEERGKAKALAKMEFLYQLLKLASRLWRCRLNRLLHN
jgi:hypothetical protein